jgi:hypothetical protein
MSVFGEGQFAGFGDAVGQPNGPVFATKRATASHAAEFRRIIN